MLKKYLCLIESFSLSFFFAQRAAGGDEMRVGSISPHFPNKSLKKEEKKRS